MHHGGNLENNFHLNFVKDDGSYLNLTLCCEINAHMNDIIVQQDIIFIKKSCHICTIPTKGLRSTMFNNRFSMKFYTYIKETIKDNPSHQSFQFFLRSWNLNYMFINTLWYENVDDYDFLGWKIFFH